MAPLRHCAEKTSAARSVANGRVDVLLIGAEWRTRALVRAELIEQGYEVVAVDEWPIPGGYVQRPETPRIAVVDLRGLPNPERVFEELGCHMGPERVIAVTAIGTIPADQLRQFGFQVVERPASVAQIVAAAARVLATASEAAT